MPCGSLPAGSEGAFASLAFEVGAQLPGALDSKFSFVAGMDVKISVALKGDMLVSFLLPAGADPASYSILFWDGAKWVELSGYVSADGMFNVQSNLAGVYVLVSK